MESTAGAAGATTAPTTAPSSSKTGPELAAATVAAAAAAAEEAEEEAEAEATATSLSHTSSISTLRLGGAAAAAAAEEEDEAAVDCEEGEGREEVGAGRVASRARPAREAGLDFSGTVSSSGNSSATAAADAAEVPRAPAPPDGLLLLPHAGRRLLLLGALGHQLVVDVSIDVAVCPLRAVLRVLGGHRSLHSCLVRGVGCLFPGALLRGEAAQALGARRV